MKGSKRLNHLSESQTLAITKLVRDLKAKGQDIVGLTLGEPDFDTPAHIGDAAIAAIHGGFTHYPPVAGFPELREAIAKKFQSENNLPWKAENVVVSTGAKQSLVNAIMALVDPGEEVVMIAPYWVSYLEMIKMAEGEPVVIHTDVSTGYKATAAQLEAALSDKTRMFILNSPSNPTGSMYSREELEAMAAVLEKYPNVFVLSDEIYEYLSFDEAHFSIGSLPSMVDRTITVNGFSKGFAMTGWRVGYIGAPKWIADLCEKFQGQITSGSNSIAQKAAQAAISDDRATVSEMREKFRARRDFLAGELAKIPGIKMYSPEGAFYLYPDLSNFLGKTAPSGKVMDNIDVLTMYLIEEAGVALIPGTAFGTDHHVRISYAYATELLQEGARRIHQGLVNLK